MKNDLSRKITAGYIAKTLDDVASVKIDGETVENLPEAIEAYDQATAQQDKSSKKGNRAGQWAQKKSQQIKNWAEEDVHVVPHYVGPPSLTKPLEHQIQKQTAQVERAQRKAVGTLLNQGKAVSNELKYQVDVAAEFAVKPAVQGLKTAAAKSGRWLSALWSYAPTQVKYAGQRAVEAVQLGVLTGLELQMDLHPEKVAQVHQAEITFKDGSTKIEHAETVDKKASTTLHNLKRGKAILGANPLTPGSGLPIFGASAITMMMGSWMTRFGNKGLSQALQRSAGQSSALAVAALGLWATDLVYAAVLAQDIKLKQRVEELPTVRVVDATHGEAKPLKERWRAANDKAKNTLYLQAKAKQLAESAPEALKEIRSAFLKETLEKHMNASRLHELSQIHTENHETALAEATEQLAAEYGEEEAMAAKVALISHVALKRAEAKQDKAEVEPHQVMRNSAKALDGAAQELAEHKAEEAPKKSMETILRLVLDEYQTIQKLRKDGQKDHV